MKYLKILNCMSTLYIVATPIGNLEDISMRAIRILGEVDFVLCEDTRTTGVLLKHYNIETKTISYHQHSDRKKSDYLLRLLEEGKNLALVTDAGTPGISDPGGLLVEMVIEHFGETVKIESVPGPSAVTAALSISGVPTDKFVFLGFPPHKSGRQKFLERIAYSTETVVVYESKHRILKFLDELVILNKEIEKKNQEVDSMDDYHRKKERYIKHAPLTSIVVCREISKMHETVYRGELENVIERIKENKDDQRGEFVVIIGR